MTIKEFRVAGQVSEGEAVRSYIAVIRGMEEVFDMLCGGVIPCDDYTRDDLGAYCASLTEGQRGRLVNEYGWVLERGSWCVAPDIRGMGLEERVDFVMVPTYLAVSTMSRVILDFPEIAAGIPRYHEALSGGLSFASLRSFMGHGYEAEDGRLRALMLFHRGGVLELLARNPGFCPEFSRAIADAEADIRRRLERADTHRGWNRDYAEEYREIIAAVFDREVRKGDHLGRV
jgi:hypothetical protein